MRKVVLGDEPIPGEADDAVGHLPRERLDLVQDVAHRVEHEQDAQVLVALEILRDLGLFHLLLPYFSFASTSPNFA